jgi:ParB/RepB/Spo0J family partition protein
MDNNEHNTQLTEKYILLPLDSLNFINELRLKYVDKSLIELAISIKNIGQLQPILACKKNERYIIIFGHRRCIAAYFAGLKTIKALIVPYPNFIDLLYMRINENEHNILHSKEERNKYIKLLIENGETINNIAMKTGKSIAWVQLYSSALEKKEKPTVPENSPEKIWYKSAEDALKNATEEEIEKALELILPPIEKTYL